MNRTLHAVAIAVLIASAPSALSAAEPKWDKLETKHYDILHSCSKTEAAYLGEWMEFVYSAYAWIIKVQPTSEKFTIKLYKDRREFLAYGNPEGAGAFYVPWTKTLCGFYDKDVVFPFFAHEGTHQFVHMAVPKMMEIIPTWFNEGIADCMGCSKVINKNLHICLFDTIVSKSRCQVIQKALREGKAKPLKDFMALNHQQFMQDADLHYAQSWSFVHFLFSYPDVEQPKRIYPNGKYKQAIVVFFEEIRKETPHAEAWAKALAEIGKTNDELEAEWKDYVLNTLPGLKPGDAYVGVRTKAHPRGGLEVVELVKDGPAEKSGLLVGDRIIYFAGERVKTTDEFVAEIKKRKPGDEIELTIVRNQRTSKIKLVMGKRED